MKITLVAMALLLCGCSVLSAETPKTNGSKETQIAQLKSRLLRNESFSPNKADNEKIAGKEANRLYGRICESASRISATPQMIQSAFMTFIAYGGRNLVHSNDEALSVVELCVGKLRSRYPMISQAEINSEIRKLVQGDL